VARRASDRALVSNLRNIQRDAAQNGRVRSKDSQG
jgi:hypothetical protein